MKSVRGQRWLPLFLIIVGCLRAIGVQGAAIEERFIPHFITSDNAAPTAVPVQVVNATTSSASGSAVNDSPIVINQGSPGKKIQITITKEFGVHQGHPASAHAAHAAHTGAAPVHNSHATTHVHPAHGAHGGHAVQGGNAPAQLQLNNGPVLVDNETMADLLQQILAGNIQNVESHGRPLALPPNGKPVAVIFSSSMHVVDLGDLRPPTTPAPVTQRPHTHAPHAPHNASAHPPHNASVLSGHASHPGHPGHPGLNHSSLLETLMSPLLSLTHLGHAPPAAPVQQTVVPVAQAPIQMQQVQMQPIVMMVPVSQLQGVPMSQVQAVPVSSVGSAPSASVDSSLQLNGVLQGIIAAKQQLLESTLLASHGTHPTHPGHVVVAHPAPAAPITATPPVPPTTAAPTRVTPAPVVIVQQPKKVKRIELSITKVKDF